MVTTVTGNTGTAEAPEGRGGVVLKTGRGGGRGPRGGPNGKGGPGGGGPDGSGGGGPRKWSPDRYRIGVFVGIASILMMFTALASAYIVRSGLPGSVDWRSMPVPRFVWLSTLLIIASSLTISRARVALRRSDASRYGLWLWLTLALGLGFVVSQLLAWRQLVAEGVYMASNPHSSFFYVLTGLHGLHLLGGMMGLAYLLLFAGRAARGPEFEVKRQALTDMVAIYWHFMDVLWVFLFLLLFLWR